MRDYDYDERLEGPRPDPKTRRMDRLQRLICNGNWSGYNKINTLRWLEDKTWPGGGRWVAWKDPDPLRASD